MRIWIDLANSPHVPFFRALHAEFVARGHEVLFTARDFAQTVSLATQAQLLPELIGEHGGRSIRGKATNLATRAWNLAQWARQRQIGLAVSHNSYSQILAARALRLPTVTLMDYEFQPANHLAFRLSTRVVVPSCFPDAQLRSYGARADKVRRYNGTKEDVYLGDYEADSSFKTRLAELGIGADHVLVTMRPPAHDALYHRFQNTLFDEALEHVLSNNEARVILLPRNNAQRQLYAQRNHPNLIVPTESLPGAALIASSDLVISAGGTINREAGALGIPAVSVYAGQWAAVDEMLLNEGRLKRISSTEELKLLVIGKKAAATRKGATEVRAQVARLILD